MSLKYATYYDPKTRQILSVRGVVGQDYIRCSEGCHYVYDTQTCTAEQFLPILDLLRFVQVISPADYPNLFEYDGVGWKTK